MKKLLHLGTILSISLLLGACSGNGETTDSTATNSTGQTEIETLTLGVMPSTDNIPLILAHELGFDEKHGVSIELETFKAARDRDAAFQAGQVDGINSDLIALAIYREAGQDVKITGSTFGEFDLITGDDSVKTVADLKGKEIALMKNNGPEYAASKMLEAAGLSKDDVTFSEVPAVPTRLEMLNNNQIAGAILPEPYVTMGTADGLRVLDSTPEIGINPFIMCFPEETIKDKTEAIRGMYEAYNEAVEYMQSHDKSEYIQLFIDEVGFPESLKDQIEIPAYTMATQTTETDITEAFAWATEKGLLTKELTPEDVLSDVYFN